jgi:hypothetical protein
MCHGFDISDRRDLERETEDDESDRPSFANESASVESEVLTDGGDETDDDE